MDVNNDHQGHEDANADLPAAREDNRMSAALKIAASTEFRIEKGVPLPGHTRGSKYPFSRMEVGDSFTVPTSMRKVVMVAHNYGHKNGKKFATRTIGEVLRIWRIA